MIRNLLRLVRLALVAAVIGWSVAPASAAPHGLGSFALRRHPDTSPDRTSSVDRTRSERPPADPELGLVWIAVGVAILVFLVWVAVRIGDNDR
jgi:hypothetical protein